jgi:MYXO-CTERM domain-containing protein
VGRTLAPILALSMLLAAPASAQDGGVIRCDGLPLRGPQEVFPAVSAVAVTLDAPVRVLYSPDFFTGGLGGDPTMLFSMQSCPTSACDLTACDEPGENVPGRVQVLGDDLVFLPDAPFLPNRAYSGVALGLDADLPFRFCTGSSNDSGPPTLGPIDEVTSTAVEPNCDAPDGGYRIAVFFTPATDVGPPGSIEFLLFQTRGPGIEGPVLRRRVRNQTPDRVTMAFVLPPDQAESPICVRVVAVDGVGNIDLSDAEVSGQTCVDPVQGNFFYGLCSVSARGSTGGPSWPIGSLGIGAIVAWRRRRRARG